MKKIVAILFIVFFSCKASEPKFNKKEGFVIPAQQVSNSDIASVIRSLERTKNISIMFKGK